MITRIITGFIINNKFMNKFGILNAKAKNGLKTYGIRGAVFLAAVSMIFSVFAPLGIANAAVAPLDSTLKLTKIVDGGDASASDWTLTATLQGQQSPALTDEGEVEGMIFSGTYVLAESGEVAGYTAGDWSCVDTTSEDTVTVDDNEIVVAPDSHVECTITNTFASDEQKDATPNLHIIKVVCPSYSDIAGNELGDLYDNTNGQFVNFTNYSADEPHYPEFNGYVSPNEIPENCERSTGWNFKLSSDHDQQNDVQNVVTGENGEYVTPISGPNSDLSENLQDATQNGILWVSENDDREGYSFGAFRCYSDGFHCDNLEVVETYNNTPFQDDIYCIAYNVSEDDGGNGNGDGNDVTGMVYSDENQNDDRDAEENGLAGWTINLLSVSDNAESTTLDESLVATTESDSDGNYVFHDVADGCYIVRETPQDSWDQTEPVPNNHDYLINVGGADCDFNVVPENQIGFMSLFVKTASAAQDTDTFVAYVGQALDFGNYDNSNGSSSGGSKRNPRVLGDSTDTPSTPSNPQVLGDVTELPRTGMPISILFTLFALLAIVMVPKIRIQIEKK